MIQVSCSYFVYEIRRWSFGLIGTKESAYIHALTSAGIAYAITKACSSGRLDSCGCDMTIKDKFYNQTIRWSGCSDNVLFATEITRKFVNIRELKVKNRTSLLNIHNNQVGIRVIFRILLNLQQQKSIFFVVDNSSIG